MINALVKWIPFRGYFLNLFPYDMHLTGGLINFYDKDGNVIPFSLYDGCRFWFKINRDECNLRRKINFTRNEVFAIKGKQYGETSYVVYIPIDAVEVKFIGKKQKSLDGYNVRHWNEYTIKVDNYGWWGGKPDNEKLKYKDNVITFEVTTAYKENSKQKYVNRIKNDIQKTCGVDISDYELKKILKYYDIVKKG